MFDLSEVEPRFFREVQVPISMDSMQEFFQDPRIRFQINYTKSLIKGASFMRYVESIDVPGDILDAERIPSIEKNICLKWFMQSQRVSVISCFTRALAQVLLVEKGVEFGTQMGSAFFSAEELSQFTQQNRALVQKYVRFCDNLPLLALSATAGFRDQFAGGADASVAVIDDPAHIGHNVISLFYLKNFFEFYFSSHQTIEPTFYTRQFGDLVFRGKSLFQHFSNPNNTLLGTLLTVLDEP